MLLVTSSRPLRDVVARALASHGATLIHSATVLGRQGSSSARRYDLVMVDLDARADGGLRVLSQWDWAWPGVAKLPLVDRGDIPMTVQAVKAGAANCIEKPVEKARVRVVIAELRDPRELSTGRTGLTLTKTEKKVRQLVLERGTNQQAAEAWHRSVRTIEVHRRNIMHKLGASSVVDLVREAGRRGLLHSHAEG